jgi:hypothetical protein
MTEIPPATKNDVKEFVRLDDGLKEARAQTKVARKEMENCREKIIAYMKSNNIGRLGIKKGTQFLETKEKILKIRPRAEVVKLKLQELINKGISDPEAIYKAIQECGVTKAVWKLSRRSKRKPKEPKKKKEPITTAD